MWDGWYDAEPDWEDAILARQEQQEIDEDNFNVDFDEYDNSCAIYEWLGKCCGGKND